MCTISINVDEAALRELCPELDSMDAIQAWIQQEIDLQIQQMKMEDEKTIDLETTREMTLAAVREEYAKL